MCLLQIGKRNTNFSRLSFVMAVQSMFDTFIYLVCEAIGSAANPGL
jgi:hypothetical protein